MESDRRQAYQVVLAASLLHVKWDLACWYGGFRWLRPWSGRWQARTARRAAFRSAAFHNLAIFASNDFVGFSEDLFWQGVERFQRDFPESAYADYRGMFEKCLRGEEVAIIHPRGYD